MSPRLLLACLCVGLASPVIAQQPRPVDAQAETVLAAGRKAYTEGNLAVARERFQEVVTKFGNTPQASVARLGLGLVILTGDNPDYVKAAEFLQKASEDGGFAERGQALYQVAVCYRAIGQKDARDNAAKPDAGKAGFERATGAFRTAQDWYQGKKDDEAAARCRCDVAELQLRLGKFNEARDTVAVFVKDPAFAKSKERKLGLYYHGLAAFLMKDYPTAARSLNQLAPFTDPAFGLHAEYLVGRVMQLTGESAEASVHYDAVLTRYEKERKDAEEALKRPDQFKGKPFEKARLEALVKAVPEAVLASRFHAAGLNYEGGKFAEALAKFQAFAKDADKSPLAPDANLRAGLCLVQLKQFDDAEKALKPLADNPRLGDQAQFALGRVALQKALAADGGDKEKLKGPLEALKKAIDKARPGANNNPEAQARLHEMRLELADGYLAARQYGPAAEVYEQLFNERVLPARREEILQRLASALGAAGQFDRSQQRCEEFRKEFPQSTLTPAVALRQADNLFARAVTLANSKPPSGEAPGKFAEAAAKYGEVAEKYPEFERVGAARYGQGVCLVQVGNIEEAAKALEAIPATDRVGDFADAGYLLADCLMRQAPFKADDALAENQIREKLAAAATLLESYVGANPKAPEAAAAMLKLGNCTKRLGATLADQNERNQTLNRARETFEKLAKDYPQSPFAAQGLLERAKVKAMMGDRGGAMNDLRAFLNDANLQKTAVAPLALLHLASMHREQNQAPEAAKVLDEARKRYEVELSRDPQRAEWANLLKYHHAVALAESDKAADALPLFEQVGHAAGGKPLGAEGELRVGQTKLAIARKKLDAAKQAQGQAGNDKAKQEAARQLAEQARRGVQEACDQLDSRGEALKQGLPMEPARLRMFYEAAWGWRTLADLEVAKLREASPAVPREKLPATPSEVKAGASYGRLIEQGRDTLLAVDARFEAAELLAERGDHAGAVPLLKAALEAEPADKPAPPETLERVRVRLGESLLATGDQAGAAAQFEAVAGNPKSPYLAAALYRVGAARLAAGDFAKAAEKLAVFRDKGEFHNRDGVSDRAMLALGQALIGLKQYDAARQAFETLIGRFGNTNPLALEARYGVAQAFQNQSKYDEAIAAYQAVIAATKRELAAKAQLEIGLCRLSQKKPADAAAAFLVVPFTYPSFPEVGFAARLEAGRAYIAADKRAEAEAVLRKLVAETPAESEWHKAAEERLKALPPAK